MKFTSKCNDCGKVLDKDSKGQPYLSQSRADQALAMHVGRSHSKVIPTYMGGSKPLTQRRRQLVLAGAAGNVVKTFNGNGNGSGRKGKLSVEQQQTIVQFICAHRDEYKTKVACFTDALKHAGVETIIKNSSVAVTRYFDKADAAPALKRHYIKRQAQVEVAETPVEHAHETILKRCPGCGLMLDGAEEMLQLLQQSPEVVHLALSAARKMMARKTPTT